MACLHLVLLCLIGQRLYKISFPMPNHQTHNHSPQRKSPNPLWLLNEFDRLEAVIETQSDTNCSP
jgi:hypothetical protein